MIYTHIGSVQAYVLPRAGQPQIQGYPRSRGLGIPPKYPILGYPDLDPFWEGIWPKGMGIATISLKYPAPGGPRKWPKYGYFRGFGDPILDPSRDPFWEGICPFDGLYAYIPLNTPPGGGPE